MSEIGDCLLVGNHFGILNDMNIKLISLVWLGRGNREELVSYVGMQRVGKVILLPVGDVEQCRKEKANESTFTSTMVTANNAYPRMV